MSTGSISVHKAPGLRAKYFIFAFIGIIFAYVLRHNEHFLIDPKDPIWSH
jgi:hypothetical protein